MTYVLGFFSSCLGSYLIKSWCNYINYVIHTQKSLIKYIIIGTYKGNHILYKNHYMYVVSASWLIRNISCIENYQVGRNIQNRFCKNIQNRFYSGFVWVVFFRRIWLKRHFLPIVLLLWKKPKEMKGNKKNKSFHSVLFFCFYF